MNRGALLLSRHHTGGEVEPPVESAFGNTLVGAGKSQIGPERERVWPATLTGEAVLVSELMMYLEPTGVSGEQKLKALIYSDNKGAPETLVAEGSEVIFKSSEEGGWKPLFFSTPVGLEPGVWWLGVMNGNPTENVTGYRYETVASSRHYKARTYTEKAAATFGAATIDSEQASIYAPYHTGVAPGPPGNLTAPMVGGTPQEGFTLTNVPGSWSRSPTSFGHQWVRCDVNGASGVAIPGATGGTYGVVKADVGSTIRVQETATNGSGTSPPASSAQTAVVTAASTGVKIVPGMVMSSSPETGADPGTVEILKPKVIRCEFGIGEGVTKLVKQWSFFHAKGVEVQPLAGAQSRIPSASEAKGLKGWAEAIPSLKFIEMMNETNYPKQLNNSKERAEEYGVRVREAAEVCTPLGTGILCQLSDAGFAGNNNWIEGVFKTVPNIASYIAGITIHPYSGAKTAAEKDSFGVPMMTRLREQLQKHGVPTTMPIDITEWGFTSANGIVLNDGKHYTYAEAAKMLPAHKAELIAAAKPYSIRSFQIYQSHDQQSVGAGTEREWYFGTVKSNGEAKGEYTTAVKTFLGE